MHREELKKSNSGGHEFLHGMSSLLQSESDNKTSVRWDEVSSRTDSTAGFRSFFLL